MEYKINANDIYDESNLENERNIYIKIKKKRRNKKFKKRALWRVGGECLLSLAGRLVGRNRLSKVAILRTRDRNESETLKRVSV